MIHAAPLDSPRLYAVLALLRERGKRGATTLELHQVTNDMAPATTVSELRANGVTVDCRYEGKHAETGRKIYRYTLVSMPPVTSPTLTAQDAAIPMASAKDAQSHTFAKQLFMDAVGTMRDQFGTP